MMEPISLILTALTAGAMAALQETASTVIKDTYQGLIALISKRFDKDAKAKATLDGYAEDPKTWEKPLEKTIKEFNLSTDKEILAIAQKLLDLVKESGNRTKYKVDIQGDIQGFVQGDNTKVTMNFNKPPTSRKK